MKNVSADDGLLTITRRNTRPKTSTSGRDYSEPIPIDLIIEIFLRLAPKSIAICRCVSKLWASILCRTDFTELFFTNSSTRPKLLFAGEDHLGTVSFFSAPHPKKKSSSIAASFHKKVAFNLPYERMISHVNGLVLGRAEHILEGRENTVLVPLLCNPSTGQSITLPKVKTRRKIRVTSFLGYDPIDKQYKVLSMTSTLYKSACKEYQVLTLGTEKPSWRMIDCCLPVHYSPLQKGICINGVLYYKAAFSSSCMIVCFDVRYERFTCVKLEKGLGTDGTLINYNGKLGVVLIQRCVDGKSIELWVLEDAEKQGWSKHTNVLSDLCKDLVGSTSLYVVGVNRTNEIVLSPYYRNMPLYLFYYNMERNTMERFGIQGFDASNYSNRHIFVDHIEDVKLM